MKHSDTTPSRPPLRPEPLGIAAFVLGLAAVAWVGASYVGHNTPALLMSALIAAVYLAGGRELRRYHADTRALGAALARLPQPLPVLADWLRDLPTGLQQPVRLRVEGERAGLPGPALTPYLVGLLVLLGMLGTFLGMVVTLNGTVGALEATTDLPAMRAALGAPVRGLGLSFGTSIAGVAASAMLGLVSALCRRERARTGQQLDALIAGPLRPFSLAQQRDSTLQTLQAQTAALQAQSEALPAVLHQLNALASQMAQQHAQVVAQHQQVLQDLAQRQQQQASRQADQNQALVQQLIGHGSQLGSQLSEQQRALVTQMADQHQRLVAQMAEQHQTLVQQSGEQQRGLTERIAAQHQGLTEGLLAHGAAQAAEQHARQEAFTRQLQQQHAALASALEAGQQHFHAATREVYTGLAASVDQSLQRSLTESARLAGAAIEPVVQATMAGIAREASTLHAQTAATAEQQLQALAGRFSGSVDSLTQGWQQALAEHTERSAALGSGLSQALQQFNEGFEQRAGALLASVERSHGALQHTLESQVGRLTQETAALQARGSEQIAQQLAAVSTRLDTAVGAVAQTWQAALDQQQRSGEAVAGALQQALSAFAESFSAQAGSLLSTLDDSHQRLQGALAERDAQRLGHMTSALQDLAASLQREWQQAGAQQLAQQQQVCQTLETTAARIHAQAEAHARSTVDEIAGLMHTASEAPRAAAEAMGALRQALSDSLVRDQEVLAERSRIMATLATLLETVQHAATEQRGAIDALVSGSAELLQRTGAQFSAQLEAEAGRLQGAADQTQGSAIEVASLAETLGLAVQGFSQSSEALVGHLQRIEAALDKSMARSDDQLAYYVAQAREIIDLSLMSQKQIVDDLQQRALRPALPAAADEAV